MFVWAFILSFFASSNPSLLTFQSLNFVSFVSRYEEEVALRATAENEFVALKKVSDPRILVPQLRTEGRGRRELFIIQRG